MKSLFGRLERLTSELRDSKEDRRTELLAWSFERAPSFALFFLEQVLGETVDGAAPGFRLETMTQRSVRGSRENHGSVDLSLDWYLDDLQLGQVFVEVKWNARGEHGEQLDTYEYALRGKESSPPVPIRRLAYLTKLGAKRPVAGSGRHFKIDHHLTWEAVGQWAKMYLRLATKERPLVTGGLSGDVQASAVDELLLALEEENMVIQPVTRDHMQSGLRFMELSRWMERTLEEVDVELKKQPLSGVKIGWDMDIEQITTHGRWIGGGKISWAQEPMEYGVGFLFEPHRLVEGIAQHFPDPAPLAVAWVEWGPEEEKYDEARRYVNDRLVGAAGVILVEEPRTHVLAYSARYLSDLVGSDGDEFGVEARKFLVDSVSVLVSSLADQG